MHISIIVPSLRGGGAEHAVIKTVNGLVSRGHKVDLVLFNMSIHYRLAADIPDAVSLFFLNDASDKQTLENPAYWALHSRFVQLRAETYDLAIFIRLAASMKFASLKKPNRFLFRGRMIRYHHAIAEYYRRRKPEIVFSHLGDPHIVAMAPSFVGGSPPIVPVMHADIESPFERRYLPRYELMFSKATRVVAVSKGIAKKLPSIINVPRERVKTIYNPVIPPNLEELKKQTPTHPWLTTAEPPVILACGSLSSVKGLRVLIRGFALLSESRNCRLVILGEGRERKGLENLVSRLGLENKVSLPGWVDNPYAFMSTASLFAMSSRYEGLPTVLIEALACGCPCVSTNCSSGPAEILENGRFGRLVPVDDYAALADAMAQTLDNPPDKQMLINRGKFFSIERSIDEYEALAEEITGRRNT